MCTGVHAHMLYILTQKIEREKGRETREEDGDREKHGGRVAGSEEVS